MRVLTCSAHILTKPCKFQHYFLTLGIVPWNILIGPMHVLTCPMRVLTCSAHILTKTCKFQHYFLTLGIVPWNILIDLMALVVSLNKSFNMFCAHFDKNLQISTLFLNTWNCSLEHFYRSHGTFGRVPCAF